jgi:hypothetical protein
VGDLSDYADWEPEPLPDGRDLLTNELLRSIEAELASEVSERHVHGQQVSGVATCVACDHTLFITMERCDRHAPSIDIPHARERTASPRCQLAAPRTHDAIRDHARPGNDGPYRRLRVGQPPSRPVRYRPLSIRLW